MAKRTPYVFKNNTRNCEHCNIQFKPVRNDARYCGQLCAVRGRKGRPHHRECADCGTDITHRMQNAKFCQDCSTIRDQNRMYPGTCQQCGNQFESSSRRQKFCSAVCGGQSSRAQQLSVQHTKQCPICWESYTTYDNRKKECSIACKMWRKKYPGVQRILDRECRYCLTPFRGTTAAQRYCTRACGSYAARVRRRGREAAAFVEDVSKGVVAKRDKWICQLCGERVERKLRHPHPMSWSLDHIIPIALDGEHSYANTQLAHLGCNSRKGDRIVEPIQLALIG